MQQSNFIFAMLLIAFLVFITVRGELPAYIDILRGGTGNANSGSLGNTASNLLNSTNNNTFSLFGANQNPSAINLSNIFGSNNTITPLPSLPSINNNSAMTPDQAAGIIDVFGGN